MRYTLWSRGRLLGYTELDLPHVQDHVRMGFIEPTEEGLRRLPDATGVPAAAHALARAARRAADARDTSLTELADFRAACDRREALELALRDETDTVFACEWIRVYDIDDQSAWAEDELDEDFDFDDDELIDPELEEAIEHDLEIMESSFDDDAGGALSWEPPDVRWETTRYHMMVFLARAKPSGG